jgi:hypothetical protein
LDSERVSHCRFHCGVSIDRAGTGKYNALSCAFSSLRSTALSLPQFLTEGWCRFARDDRLASWAEHALPAARATLGAPEHARWWRCRDTWFVGVNALPNDAAGAVAGGPALAGRAVDFIRRELGLESFAWDRAQVSVVRPGYPQPMATESEAAFRYRVERDAAHVDGVKREGPRRRRHLLGHHRFLRGIPLVAADPGASPLVVWARSHELVRQALLARFGGMAPERWRHEDVTELYRSLRERIFASCERVELPALPGEAYLVHRLALHGIAPWSAPASAGARIILYFRPETEPTEAWLSLP